MRINAMGVLALLAIFGSTSPTYGQTASRHPSFRLSRLAQKLPPDTEWAVFQEGVFCRTKETLKGDGVLREASLEPYQPLFDKEMAQAGAANTPAEVDLFATDTQSTPDYQVGALVHDIQLKLCNQPRPPSSLVIPVERGGVKGTASMAIQWQIFSTANREVVTTIETSATYSLEKRRGADALGVIMSGAFEENVKQLVQDAAWRALVNTPAPTDLTRSQPGSQARISAATVTAAPRAAADAAGAVVLVQTPEGHGSGALISTDGYILTNAHVVGLQKTVVIRWSDQLETKGEVVRVHEGRDVALIKTDSRGRLPLTVRPARLQPGDAVLAIGAPLEEDLQGTITRGIVSADRIIDGYSFIQSDVSVNHGNSGGPLLDSRGMLVGLTDIGLAPNGDPVDLNFFIPIRDALDFLSVDLTPGQKRVAGEASNGAGRRSR